MLGMFFETQCMCVCIYIEVYRQDESHSQPETVTIIMHMVCFCGFGIFYVGWVLFISWKSENHGLCGSNKLLYKWYAKSMERPKLRHPAAPTFFNRS